MKNLIVALSLAALTTVANASWWNIIFQPACGGTICEKFNRK